MTKKDYMKPAMEVVEADLEQQLLVTSVKTDGLDELDLLIDEIEKTGDTWDDAQRKLREHYGF